MGGPSGWPTPPPLMGRSRAGPVPVDSGSSPGGCKALMREYSFSSTLLASTYLIFLSMRKGVAAHHFTRINSRGKRVTAFNTGNCRLLPGGLGQLVAQACGLGGPYLLLWAYLAQVEGASMEEVMAVLKELGFVPEFLWKVAGSQGGAHVHPVSTVLVLCCHVID